MKNSEKQQLVQELYEKYPYPNRGVKTKKEATHYVSWVTRIFGEQNNFWKDKTVLELGCGTGELACGLALSGGKVHAIDLSSASIRKAKENSIMVNAKVNFEQKNILEFSEKDENNKYVQYDVVIALGSLHHTIDAHKGFIVGTKHLKKNGIIIVGLYNKYSRFRHRVKRFLLWLFCGKDIEKRIKFGEKHFARSYSKSWLADKYGQVHESYHSIREILSWFKKENIAYITSNPKHKTPTLDEIMWLFEKKNAFFVMVGRKK